MFEAHKGATAVGAVGAVIVLGHLVLGPDVVPVGGVLLGLLVVALAGLYVYAAERRSRPPGG